MLNELKKSLAGFLEPKKEHGTRTSLEGVTPEFIKETARTSGTLPTEILVELAKQIEKSKFKDKKSLASLMRAIAQQESLGGFLDPINMFRVDWQDEAGREHITPESNIKASLDHVLSPSRHIEDYDITNPRGQARYWKDQYNTYKGKGTLEQFLANYPN